MNQVTDDEHRALSASDDRFRRDHAPREDFVTLVGSGVNRRLLGADFMRVVVAAQDPTKQAATVWAAGGAVRDWCIGQPRRDLDLFFRGADEYELGLRRLLGNPTLGARLVEANDAVARLDTDVGRVDLVRALYFRNPIHVLGRFDFTACAALTDAWGRLVHHVAFEDDAPAGRVVVNALPCPLSSLWRASKLRQRGWTMRKDEFRGLLDRAVNHPESDGWVSEGSPPKGMPLWARAAWDALGMTGDKKLLPRVMLRASLDDGWAREIEGLVMLAEGMPETRSLLNLAITRGRADDIVRDFLVASLREEVEL